MIKQIIYLLVFIFYSNSILTIGYIVEKLSKPKNYNQQLLDAARIGDLELVKNALDNKADPNIREQENTPLLNAIKYYNNPEGVIDWLKAKAYADRDRRTEVIITLLNAKASADAGDRLSSTPLHCAAEMGYTDAVAALLKANAITNVKDQNQRTPLQLAARSHHSEIFERLLHDGAILTGENLEFPNDYRYWLGDDHFKKIKIENVKINNIILNFRYLLTVLSDTIWQSTALPKPITRLISQYFHEENGQQYSENLQEMTLALSYINVPDFINMPPLLRAVAESNSDAVSALLKWTNPNIDARDEKGYTPLMLATMFGNEIFVKLLLEKRANPTLNIIIDGKHLCACDLAEERQYKKIAELLKTCTIDYTRRSQELCQILLKNFDTNRLVFNGGGNYESCDHILKKGIDVNAIVFTGREYLKIIEVATYCNNYEIVKYLIDAKSELRPTNESWRFDTGTYKIICNDDGNNERVSLGGHWEDGYSSITNYNEIIKLLSANGATNLNKEGCVIL